MEKIYWLILIDFKRKFIVQNMVSMGGEYLAIGPRSNRCIDILPSMKVSITMRLNEASSKNDDTAHA